MREIKMKVITVKFLLCAGYLDIQFKYYFSLTSSGQYLQSEWNLNPFHFEYWDVLVACIETFYHFSLPRKVLLPQSHFHPYTCEKLITRPRSRLELEFLAKGSREVFAPKLMQLLVELIFMQCSMEVSASLLLVGPVFTSRCF